MYRRNVERNKAIYELWENGLTITEIASQTGIPRGTVGYYVRKFNRLAAEGRPIVLPKEGKVTREASTSPEILQATAKINIKMARMSIIEMFNAGEYQKVYYILSAMKLMKDLDRIVALDTFGKLSGLIPQS